MAFNYGKLTTKKKKTYEIKLKSGLNLFFFYFYSAANSVTMKSHCGHNETEITNGNEMLQVLVRVKFEMNC